MILKMKKLFYNFLNEDQGDYLNDDEYENEKAFMFLMMMMIMMVVTKDNSKCS